MSARVGAAVSTPFSEAVATKEWLVEATVWVAAVMREHGQEIVGPVRQVRVRPWSTQLVVPTTLGHLWVKQGPPALAYEGPLQMLVARLAPGAVEKPLAVDEATGRFLMPDYGPSVRDQGWDGVTDWCAVVALAARAQRHLVPHAAALVAAGIPDGSPATAVARFDALIAAEPDDVARAARLTRSRPLLLESCEALLASPFPTTWNHGDLHLGNAVGGGRTTDDALRLIDLGDGDLSCALEVLAVPRRVIEDDETWRAVLATYCEAWDVEASTGAALWEHVERLHAVNRTFAWRRALSEASAAEAERWLPDPDHLLTQLGAAS